MKRLLLFPIFLSLSILGHSSKIELLEQAIQESNLDSARSILRSLSISQPDKELLLIFAEDVLQQRRSFSALITPSSNDARRILTTIALSGAVILAAFKGLFNYNDDILGSSLGAIALVGIPTIIFKHFYDTQKWYSNAIAIKALLHKAQLCTDDKVAS